MPIMQASHVFLDNPSATRDDALLFLAGKAVELGVADSATDVLAAFKAREEQGTTGMQDGFAIPHAKTDAVKDATVMVVKFANPIADWDSLDKKPIKAAIALLVPEGEAGTTHIRLLAKTATMLMGESFRKTVLESEDPEEISKLVSEGLED